MRQHERTESLRNWQLARRRTVLSGLADRVMTVALVAIGALFGCLLLVGLVGAVILDVCRPAWGKA